MRFAGVFILGAIATSLALGAEAAATGQATGHATVSAYALPSAYRASTTHSLKANGTEVPWTARAGTLMPNRNILFDDCIAWTRCFAFKIGAGVWRDQEDITVRNCVVYDAAHAIGISHSYGSGDVRNVLFDAIDVERNTMTNLGRSWARFVIDPRKRDGGRGGGVHDVVVRNITVRDAGTDDVQVSGLSEHKQIAGVKFEGIRMPGKSAPASSLSAIGVRDVRFAEAVTIDGGNSSFPSPGTPGELSTRVRVRAVDDRRMNHINRAEPSPQPLPERNMRHWRNSARHAHLAPSPAFVIPRYSEGSRTRTDAEIPRSTSE